MTVEYSFSYMNLHYNISWNMVSLCLFIVSSLTGKDYCFKSSTATTE